uniref:RING-type E3 ubiquitin transferase (cysteine targeting) n=1 Tax=Heterorhabditis bacteriophora TaxID=37862 RepID=A0A1I7XDG1_HETBA
MSLYDDDIAPSQDKKGGANISMRFLQAQIAQKRSAIQQGISDSTPATMPPPSFLPSFGKATTKGLGVAANIMSKFGYKHGGGLGVSQSNAPMGVPSATPTSTADAMRHSSRILMLTMACASMRIEQVDANILDREFRNIIFERMDELLATVPVAFARHFEKIKPELRLFFEAVLWSTRIYGGSSPGQAELDIAYKNYDLMKVASHFILSVILPYTAKRISELRNYPIISKLLAKTEAIVETISIIHYLHFLRVGGYSTLSESLLSLRNWNNNLRTIGTINYESQNRELLWHAFRDALLLIWPGINFVHKVWANRNDSVRSTTRELECGVCGRDAIIPMRTPNCDHFTCYWCVASRPDGEGTCTICGRKSGYPIPLMGRMMMKNEEKYVD